MPQHQTAPVESRPQRLEDPDASWTSVPARPLVVTAAVGALRCAGGVGVSGELSPNSPFVPLPQQYTAPLLRRRQEPPGLLPFVQVTSSIVAPGGIVMPLRSAARGTRVLAVVPLPSWPSPPLPQHHTVLSLIATHVCCAP